MRYCSLLKFDFQVKRKEFGLYYSLAIENVFPFTSFYAFFSLSGGKEWRPGEERGRRSKKKKERKMKEKREKKKNKTATLESSYF
jgi:hypothetical protein